MFRAFVVIIVACSMVVSAAAQIDSSRHTINAQSNVYGNDFQNQSVYYQLDAGDYTITLVDSDFRENAATPDPQRHVTVRANSNFNEYQTFTLNGIGDSLEITSVGVPLWFFFVDWEPNDNTGGSTVKIRNHAGGDTLITVDGVAHCVTGNMDSAAVFKQTTAGTYTFRLISSDFRENGSTPQPQPHMVFRANSDFGDYQTFTLNGVGDEVTITTPGAPVWMFFIDNQVGDNTGSSVVDIIRAADPLSLPYEETFSVSPSFTYATTPEAGDSYSWDAGGEFYTVHLTETPSSTFKFSQSPKFSRVENSDVLIEADLRLNAHSFGMGIGMRFYDVSVGLEPAMQVHFSGSDNPRIDLIDGNGHWYQTGAPSLSTWYSVKLGYRQSSGQADILITERETGAIFYHAEDIAFTPVAFNTVGFGAQTGGGDGSTAELSYDNIRVSLEPGGAHFSLDSSFAQVGDSGAVGMWVDLPDGDTMNAFEVRTLFPSSSLGFLGYDTTSSLIGAAGWQIETHTSGDTLRIAAAGATGIAVDGRLLDLRFSAPQASCLFYPVVFDSVIVDTNSVFISTADGGLYIMPVPVFGDVNEDGLVQAYDASQVLKEVVGSLNPPLTCQQRSNADVTLDGTVSALDATGILKKVAGSIDMFPYEQIVGGGEVRILAGNQAGMIEVFLDLAHGSNVSAFEASLEYDPSVLTFTDSIWPTGSLRDLTVSDGKIRMAASSAQYFPTDANLVRLRFVAGSSVNTTTIALLSHRLNENERSTEVQTANVTITSAENSSAGIPDEYSLQQNYPNPFNPSTTISFGLPQRSIVRIAILNTLGQTIETILAGEFEAGFGSVVWYASVPSGVYFYRLETIAMGDPSKHFTQTRKLVILK